MQNPYPSLSASAIAAHVPLRDVARSYLRADLSPRAYLELLLIEELWADAIRFLPHLLPRRGAVWWGCQCLWAALRPEVPAEVNQALRPVLAWIVDPSEENREAARPHDRSAALRSPSGCLRLAVTWSGGSLSDPGLPIVAPPPHATARMVSGAVLLAAVQRDAMRYEEKYRRFLDLGLHIAAGKNLWWQPAVEVETDRLAGVAI